MSLWENNQVSPFSWYLWLLDFHSCVENKSGTPLEFSLNDAPLNSNLYVMVLATLYCLVLTSLSWILCWNIWWSSGRVSSWISLQLPYLPSCSLCRNNLQVHSQVLSCSSLTISGQSLCSTRTIRHSDITLAESECVWTSHLPCLLFVCLVSGNKGCVWDMFSSLKTMLLSLWYSQPCSTPNSWWNIA